MMYNNIFTIYWNTILDMYISSLDLVRKTWYDTK